VLYVRLQTSLVASSQNTHLSVSIQFSVQALGEALSSWGDDYGAIVVVSHDREFCSQLEFTHVATVADGKVTMEQRGVVDSDWSVNGLSSAGGSANAPVAPAAPAVVVDPVLRKKLFNAPKRILKIEREVETLEAKMAGIDEEMLACGNDLAKLTTLSKQKETAAKKVATLMQEWEELDKLLAEASS
jgi:Trm5-related predicted tRNA methylase